MAKYLLRGQRVNDHASQSRNVLVRLQKRFESVFESLRNGYRGVLERCLHHRRAFLLAFFAACLGSISVIVPWLGQDFFPAVDAGSFKLHMRGPTGMRIEDTAFLCDLVEDSIRKQIPASDVDSIIDNIGLRYSGINLSYSNSAPIGTSDADIMVTLSPKHRPTETYVRQLRLPFTRERTGTSRSGTSILVRM
jgi:multidrug efflux pump subunit AcrB